MTAALNPYKRFGALLAMSSVLYCVVIKHANSDNAERIAVDNVVMMDFQKLFIESPADGAMTEVHRGSWVVSFKGRNGKPTQVLVFADNIFRGNFETDDDTDVSENIQT